jgi:hypothetical protein
LGHNFEGDTMTGQEPIWSALLRMCTEVEAGRLPLGTRYQMPDGETIHAESAHLIALALRLVLPNMPDFARRWLGEDPERDAKALETRTRQAIKGAVRLAEQNALELAWTLAAVEGLPLSVLDGQHWPTPPARMNALQSRRQMERLRRRFQVGQLVTWAEVLEARGQRFATERHRGGHLPGLPAWIGSRLALLARRIAPHLPGGPDPDPEERHYANRRTGVYRRAVLERTAQVAGALYGMAITAEHVRKALKAAETESPPGRPPTVLFSLARSRDDLAKETRPTFLRIAHAARVATSRPPRRRPPRSGAGPLAGLPGGDHFFADLLAKVESMRPQLEELERRRAFPRCTHCGGGLRHDTTWVVLQDADAGECPICLDCAPRAIERLRRDERLQGDLLETWISP